MATGELRIGRNDLCTCGSGKKFKRCCGAVDLAAEDVSSRFFGVAAVLAGLTLVVGLVLVVSAMFSAEEASGGKVWSAEHGHYHNLDGGELNAGGPGKVWNEAHGHYHDVANGGATAGLHAEMPVAGALDGLRAAELEAAKQKATGSDADH